MGQLTITNATKLRITVTWRPAVQGAPPTDIYTIAAGDSNTHDAQEPILYEVTIRTLTGKPFEKNFFANRKAHWTFDGTDIIEVPFEKSLVQKIPLEPGPAYIPIDHPLVQSILKYLKHYLSDGTVHILPVPFPIPPEQTK